MFVYYYYYFKVDVRHSRVVHERAHKRFIKVSLCVFLVLVVYGRRVEDKKMNSVILCLYCCVAIVVVVDVWLSVDLLQAQTIWRHPPSSGQQFFSSFSRKFAKNIFSNANSPVNHIRPKTETKVAALTTIDDNRATALNSVPRCCNQMPRLV